MAKKNVLEQIKENENIPLNLPVDSDFADVLIAKEADKRNKAIKKELGKVSSSFISIAFNLYWFYDSGAYSQLGYKSIYELASKEYGVSKTTSNNFINVVERFAARDESGKVLEQIRPEYKGFQSSKLIALLGVSDDDLDKISGDMSVRDIKKKAKELRGEDVPEENASENEGDANSDDGSDDITIEAKEINRQVLVTFSNLQEYNSYLDGMNDLIEKALKSKAFKDGTKKIEVSIVC